LVFAAREAKILSTVVQFHAGAATEGRPYSTFRGTSVASTFRGTSVPVRFVALVSQYVPWMLVDISWR